MPIYLWKVRANLAAACAQIKPEVVLCHAPKFAWIARGLPELRGIPFLHWYSSCWKDEFEIDRPRGISRWIGGAVREKIERSLFKSIGSFLVLSQFMRSSLAAHGVSAEKIKVIRPGVDLDRYRPDPKTVYTPGGEL